jgi:hypothetical protein
MIWALVGDNVLAMHFALSLDLRWKGEFDFDRRIHFSTLLFRFTNGGGRQYGSW